jgi:hypothetical protein
MRTLGLAPHLVPNCLSSVSGRPVESVKHLLKALDDPRSYLLDKVSPTGPKNYEEIDRRSRFRIIQTSPSLDPRIY